MACFFCENVGGKVIYTNNLFRIILVEDENYPGFLRIILNKHLKELTDLDEVDNLYLYKAVIKCEVIVRKLFNPEKVNLASFGNVTPHVHWHIIPRFLGDKHFPNPIWGDVTNHNYQANIELINKNELLIAEIKKSFIE